MFITSSFERFVEFIDCSAESSAEEIAKIVLSKIEQYGVGNKLVAQTYGGASVMSGENSGVNVRIKEEYLEALFVHCYAHKLNFVSLQSVKEISACKRFFSTLTGISAFFSRLTRGSSHLHTFVTIRMPRAAETRCNSHARLVGSVHRIFEDLERFFKDIIENPRQWEDVSVDAASGHLTKLSDT